MCNKISALAWKIVNEVSGRHNSNRAKLKANSGKERIQIWNNHFKELLSKPLIPTSNDESTLTIQNGLDMKKGFYNRLIKDSYEKHNKWKTYNYTVGLDEIPAQVW